MRSRNGSNLLGTGIRTGLPSPRSIRLMYLRTVRRSSPSLRAIAFLGTPSSWRARTARNELVLITSLSPGTAEAARQGTELRD
jgi:hypothetical protein